MLRNKNNTFSQMINILSCFCVIVYGTADTALLYKVIESIDKHAVRPVYSSLAYNTRHKR